MQLFTFFGGFIGKYFKGEIFKMVTKKIRLKIWENNYVTLHTEKGEVDSRYIEVSFKDENLNNLNLSGKSVTFFAQKPDKTQIFNYCTVNTTTNTATVELTSEALNMAGVLICEFQVFDSNNVLLKVGGLKIIVDSEIDFNEAAESSSSADVITVILNSIGNLSLLTTTEKSSLVGAVNELDSRVVPISKGGTGGTTDTAARTNLGVMKGYTIYSNASGTQDTITYATGYTTDEFDFMEIQYFCKVSTSPSIWSRSSVKTLCNTGWRINMVAMYHDGTTFNSFTRTVEFGTSSLSLVSNTRGQMAYKSSSSGSVDNHTDNIFITQVVGYKY